MREYLLIGGAGFIGSFLTEALNPKNVTVFDNFSMISHTDSTIRKRMSSNSNFVVGDVCSREDVDLLFANGMPRVIVHLAAETGTGRSLSNCTLNARVNALGLANLLDAMSELQEFPERIILTSTRAVYGEGPYYRPDSHEIIYPSQRTRESLEKENFEFEGLVPIAMRADAHFPKPVNIYGSTKLTQENMLTAWAGAYGVSTTIFRLQNVYGPEQSLSNPYTGILIHFIKQLIGGHQVEIYENGGITRDYVHVEDVARLLASGARSTGNGVYDCGSGKRVELWSVAKMLCEAHGADNPSNSAAFRFGDVRNACADISATQSDFGWIPRIALEDGILDLYCRTKAKFNR